MVEKEKVGQKIFNLRKKLGITQDNLSRIVNVTPQAISKWENGATLPDTGLLPILSELFHVSIEELLCINNNNTINQKDLNNKILLPGIKYHNCTPPLVGCIKSSLDYIGIHVSTGWLSAPYAFMLNINDTVSFMGPENWSDNGCFDELIRNCGGIVKNFWAHKSDDKIIEKREEAWNMIRDSIDKGLPCYAWEMDKSLYYLIAGYDQTGYYYINHETMKIAGPKPYYELGDTEWGILEIHIIRPGSISDNLKTIKDIFEYAINVGSPALHPPNPGYTHGINAYKTWWEAISNETADNYGIAYNAAFWSKCKKMASLFLQEGKLRIGLMEDQFNLAITCYEDSAKALSRLSQIYPLKRNYDTPPSLDQREEAITLLKTAQESEMNGLNEINSMLNEIYKIW
jgi:transcriptional regulator with XRE-family HTH domain